MTVAQAARQHSDLFGGGRSMGWGLLPAKAIEMLRAARHDPEAVRRVELMTASFIWSAVH